MASPLQTTSPADYRRNGLTSLYAALEVASGKLLGECRARHTGADFLAFLKRLARGYRGQELHVILDNSSTHTTPAVQAWLATHPRVHFHFTPTGASWLNMVEAWFSILIRKSVRRGSFDTVRALIRCQREPKFPHLGELKIPHPRVHSVASGGRTRPALSLSLSR